MNSTRKPAPIRTKQHKKRHEQLENICFKAFGTGGHVVTHSQSNENRSFHQGVRLSGFDGVRFILDATHDKEEDWRPGRGEEPGNPTRLSVDEARQRVRQIEADRRCEAELAKNEAARERIRKRRARLAAVFSVFDFDGSGSIEAAELSKLGKAWKNRQKTKSNQKSKQQVKWSETQNANLVKQMDSSGDGLVDEPEFIHFCDKFMPQDDIEFAQVTALWEDMGRQMAVGEGPADDDELVSESDRHLAWRTEFTARVQHALAKPKAGVPKVGLDTAGVEAKIQQIRSKAQAVTRVLGTARALWADMCPGYTASDPGYNTELLSTALLARLSMEVVSSKTVDDIKLQLQTGVIDATIPGIKGLLEILKQEPWNQYLMHREEGPTIDEAITLHEQQQKEQQALKEGVVHSSDVDEDVHIPIPLSEASKEQDEARLGQPEVRSMLASMATAMLELHTHKLSSYGIRLLTDTALAKGTQQTPLSLPAFVALFNCSPWCHLLPAHLDFVKPEVDILYYQYCKCHAKILEVIKFRASRLSEVFRSFDFDTSGTIDVAELASLGGEWKQRQAETAKLRSGKGKKKIKWSEEQNQRLFDKMDTNGDGVLHEVEFIKFCDEFLPPVDRGFRDVTDCWIQIGLRSTQENLLRKEHLAQVFQAFDNDGSGFVDASELYKMGQAARERQGQQRRKRNSVKGVEWSQSQNDRLVAAMDTSGDGKVCEAEFVLFCNKMFPRDHAQFMLLSSQFTEAAQEQQKATEAESKRAVANSQKVEALELPKYGIATKLHDMRHSVSLRKAAYRTSRGKLEEQRRQYDEGVRARGRLRRKEAHSFQKQAWDKARAWREKAALAIEQPCLQPGHFPVYRGNSKHGSVFSHASLKTSRTETYLGDPLEHMEGLPMINHRPATTR